jgi:hypothetical protein
MPNYPGETFVSNGYKYVLQAGPGGNLRPYYLGPVVAAGTAFGWFGLALVGLIAVGALVVVALCSDEEDGDQAAGASS